ncbi:MAG: hypothetical protein QM817_05220 [Archangium sp.]
MSLPALLIALALTADDPISPEKSAQIEIEQEKARDEVAKKYGNKSFSELSPEERKQMSKDQDEAAKAVLDKAGVDPKQWARDALKRDRNEYAQQKELVKEIKEKQKVALEQAKKAKETVKEITVQRGISDENPVTIDEKDNEDGKPSVEQGLPPEVDSDQQAAMEQDRLENSGSADAPAAKSSGSSKGKGGGGKRR